MAGPPARRGRLRRMPHFGPATFTESCRAGGWALIGLLQRRQMRGTFPQIIAFGQQQQRLARLR
ncbi:hypothetical protein [Saccharopolyspora phatthalungensis]|uniref:Uncharacterized protein n=1 Tax=Saccharopolyspora phatthalungensis TaxID=664693 RepID=A0A840QG81_9PSEU|nr:hypothetical protein [Saccharopolyspora phatthalungensis]MBB5158960.1 hypothetical protein [Saccharopolyspora phatthalungensis]